MSTRFRHGASVVAATVLGALAVAACPARELTPSVGRPIEGAAASSGIVVAADAAAVVFEAGWVGLDISEEPARGGPLFGENASRAGVVRTDAAITSRIMVGLAADRDLNKLDISVVTISGHAVLRGTAPSDAARDRASRLANRVEGVFGVDNQLTVQRQPR